MQINSSINIALHRDWTVTKPSRSSDQSQASPHLLLRVFVMSMRGCVDFCVSFLVFRSVLGNFLPPECMDSCVPTTVIRNSGFTRSLLELDVPKTSKAGNT